MSVVAWISVLCLLVQCGSFADEHHSIGHSVVGSSGHDAGEDEAPEQGIAHRRGEVIHDIAHDTEEELPGHGAASRDAHGDPHGEEELPGHGAASHDAHGDLHGEEEELPGHGAASHDAHGDLHGEAGSHHERPSDVAVALALALMGVVAWIMSLFYFVNSADEHVRSATWGVLNVMVSIFLGVLAFKSSKDLSIDYFGEDPGAHGHQPSAKTFVFSIARSVGMYLVWNALHYQFMCWPRTRDANAVLGGHICGFAAIETFGSVMTLPFFAGNAAASLLCVFLAACVISAVFYVADLLRARVPDQKSKSVHEWREQIEENEHDCAGLCLGLLVSMVVRSLIVGSMPPVHGAPKSKSQREVWALFGVGFAFGAVLIASMYITQRYIDRPHGKRRLLSRLFGIINRTLDLTRCWCALFWGQWFFWNITGNKGVAQGSQMTARLVMSLAFSGFTFAGIIVVDCIADRCDNNPSIEKGLRALLEAFGLLMGLAWEACFTSATEGIGMLVEQSHRHLLDFLLNLALCAVVAPAWALYVLPNAQGEERASPRTVRCPHCNQSFVDPPPGAPSEGWDTENEE